ncbi:MAG: hypothetical protein V3T01_07235 [Myxococcota bacterium]
MIRPLPTLLIALLLALPAPALVIDSLALNRDPPADDPGFGNVGRRGVETAVYLGYGWVITAKHVPVGDVSFDGLTFYDLVPGSEIEIAHNMSNDADLRIYQITPWPDLPPLRIRSDPLPDPGTVTTDVLMIGFGFQAGTPISVFPPPNQDDGYLWGTPKVIRWATNQITSLLFFSESNTESFATIFDAGLPTPHEGQVANGDSGGAVFVKNAGIWELAGIIHSRDLDASQPFNSAVYTNQSFSADLSYPDYRNQIVPVVHPVCFPDCPPCNDGFDNDGDGFIDAGSDPGCRDLDWFSEAPECDDGVDNDGDGLIDILDSTCGNAWQPSESPNSSCGLGAELAWIAVPLLYLRRRRQRVRSKT